MSASDVMTDTTATRPAPHPVRPFYWSVRRELWENRAIWLAPLAVAALVIFGSLVAVVSSNHLKTLRHDTTTVSEPAQPGATPVPPSQVTTMTQSTPDGSVTVSKVIKIQGPPPTPEQRRQMAALPFYMVTAAMMLTMFLVAVFYCLGGLYNERRDRSILFWKSLPVNDTTTVLSKMMAPMAILPAVTFVIALATEVLMLAIGVLAFATHAKAQGVDADVPMGDVISLLAYVLVAQTLWWAPIYAWLLMVSGWAKRAPFLWAVLPPLGLALAEKLAFGSNYVGDLILSRVAGGYKVAFDMPRHAQPGMPRGPMVPHIDAAQFVASPELWLGLLAAAGMLAATIWMRRRREPI